MFNFLFWCPKRWFQFNSRIVRTHFWNIITLTNWKMIAETRSYIFRWRSRSSWLLKLPIKCLFTLITPLLARTKVSVWNGKKSPWPSSYCPLNFSPATMNMLLSFVLVYCVLHAVSSLFVPTRMRNSVVNLEEPNEFCDEGPPGRYCLEDLSGWHDCHVEQGEMVDTIYYCPSNTRLGRQLQLAFYVAAVIVHELDLSKDDVGHSENVIWKLYFAFLQSFLDYSKWFGSKNVY